MVDLEAEILKKQLANIQGKVAEFERRYGKLDRDALYGRVDDMELLEWEGEIETMNRLIDATVRPMISLNGMNHGADDYD